MMFSPFCLPSQQVWRATSDDATRGVLGMADADQRGGAPAEPGPPLAPVGLVFDEDCQLHAPPERFNGKPAIEHAERPERS